MPALRSMTKSAMRQSIDAFSRCRLHSLLIACKLQHIIVQAILVGQYSGFSAARCAPVFWSGSAGQITIPSLVHPCPVLSGDRRERAANVLRLFIIMSERMCRRYNKPSSVFICVHLRLNVDVDLLRGEFLPGILDVKPFLYEKIIEEGVNVFILCHELHDFEGL